MLVREEVVRIYRCDVCAEEFKVRDGSDYTYVVHIEVARDSVIYPKHVCKPCVDKLVSAQARQTAKK